MREVRKEKKQRERGNKNFKRKKVNVTNNIIIRQLKGEKKREKENYKWLGIITTFLIQKMIRAMS